LKFGAQAEVLDPKTGQLKRLSMLPRSYIEKSSEKEKEIP
jgi:hypothetical protein